MRRILFHIFNALSIVLLLASIGLCIYSFVDGQTLARTKNQGNPPTNATVHAAGATDGRMIVALLEVKSIVDDKPDTVEWEWSRFSMTDVDRIENHYQPPTWRLLGFRHYRFSSAGVFPLSGWMLVIHFAWLIPLFAILPAYWLFTRHRAPRRRARLGLCIKCGYDLRGSASNTCPECGWVREG